MRRGPAPWWILAAALAWASLPWATCAAAQTVIITGLNPGPRPFISLVTLRMADTNQLAYVRFTIAPKTGSHTRPISVRYSNAYLAGRHLLNAGTGAITVPVFGLYANRTNTVSLVFGFVDGTAQLNDLSIPTAKYVSAIFNHPATLQAPRADARLSYDFILLKSAVTGDSPTIIDTDGEVRWVGTANTMSMQSICYANSIFVSAGTTILRIEFDGSVSTVADYAAQGVTSFHHNFDFGKSGIITDVNTPDYLASANMEIDAAGNVLHTWNLATIISAAMVAGGDDPALFVAPAGSMGDWFHNNSVAYLPSDDSLAISSRENFVIDIDYETGAIKWILGDPTKLWHQFASLRKFALKAGPGTHYPIGQHAVSFYSGRLLLFDDGFNSAYQYPPGRNRTYSAPRKYVIDPAAGSATETWNYLSDPLIYSPIESSVYEDQPGNYLVDYATAGPYEYAEILGLAPGGARAFDYQFTEPAQLSTAWNAVPLHLEDMVFN